MSIFCQVGRDPVCELINNKCSVTLGVDKLCPLKAHTCAHLKLSGDIIFDRFQVQKLFVYLDGGYKSDEERHTTWGVYIVAEYLDSSQVVCLSAGGNVHFDPTCPVFWGEAPPTNTSSFVTEVYSNIVARVLVLQYFKHITYCPSKPVFHI